MGSRVDSILCGLTGEASADDLARLNAALEPIWLMTKLTFTCNMGAVNSSSGGRRRASLENAWSTPLGTMAGCA